MSHHHVAQVSCFEIYGNKVFDLLNTRKRLNILEDGKKQVWQVASHAASHHHTRHRHQQAGVVAEPRALPDNRLAQAVAVVLASIVHMIASQLPVCGLFRFLTIPSLPQADWAIRLGSRSVSLAFMLPPLFRVVSLVCRCPTLCSDMCMHRVYAGVFFASYYALRYMLCIASPV